MFHGIEFLKKYHSTKIQDRYRYRPETSKIRWMAWDKKHLGGLTHINEFLFKFNELQTLRPLAQQLHNTGKYDSGARVGNLFGVMKEPPLTTVD